MTRGPAPRVLPRERPVTDAIADAIEMLQGRLIEIDEELERYDDLRSERKQIEKTLRAMQPKVKSAGGDDDEISLVDQVLEVIASDPLARWTTALVVTELDLDSDAENKQRVASTLSKLEKAGKIRRADRGQYTLA